ncbi:MAG TPA: CDP-archaeol synthase [Gemmatimonadaceae bacterium]|nr:CDP-archaeol synthase [Gemmatimonadaceae bacterium]
MTTTDPFGIAVFLIVAFIAAGLLHSAWLASPASRSLQIPVDGGLHFRGRRLFGANKTVRGFVVMPPAAAISFCSLGMLLDATSAELRDSLWPVSNSALTLLGACAGLGFMLGELPNSFVKRQLGIPPGQPAKGSIATLLSFAADRLDSILGMLIAISIVAPTPWMTWVYVIVLGPGIHLCFSVLLYRLGVKVRAA